MKKLIVVILIFVSCSARSQFLVEMLDTTHNEKKGLYLNLKKSDHIKFSGYMQPQFQVATAKGIDSYSGGDFPANVNNRFMLRRGRIRIDYEGYTDNNKPSLQFVFQFDGTERGVAIRDFWGRVYENKFEMFAFTAGMFARPFGYEINFSSSDRESPERGRVSQMFMRTERDLGAMVTLEDRKKSNWFHYLKVDAGFFNGQGLTSPADFDSYKDFIARAAMKPFPVSKNVSLSAGLSFFQGGFIQTNKAVYEMATVNGVNIFTVDSSESNIGKKAPRRYRGADAQVKMKHGWGSTELRGEYWFGTQSSTKNNTETPALPVNEPHYIRKFDAVFFYIVQDIVNDKNQLVFKFDWYDPNTAIKGSDIGKAGTNFTQADIKYNTYGLGYLHHFNDNLKLVLWYDHVKNESTSLTGYTSDIDDDVFTCRLQFRF